MFSQADFMFGKKRALMIYGLIFSLVWLVPLVVVQAQTDQTGLAALMVEIWPEYDRPETLVIYRGQLADSTPLPATVTFDLPAHVEQMFAVAVLSETGELITHPYQFEAGRLTFTLTGRNFQFEYYDPAVVTKEGVQRTLKFSARTGYPIAALQVEVQQPLHVASMEFQPAPDQAAAGADQQTHYFFNYRDVPAGPMIDLAGAYAKPDDSLVIQPDAPVATATTAPANAGRQGLGYGLIGLGVAILLGVGGFWFGRRQSAPATAGHRPHRATESKAASSAQPAVDSRFCYRCGTPYKPEALFCHKCGAPRR